MDAHLNVHCAMAQEKKDKDKMINFNSLWRNVAEHGFPEAGNADSLKKVQCKSYKGHPLCYCEPGWNEGEYIFFDPTNNAYVPCTLNSIFYLNDSEEAFRDMINKGVDFSFKKGEKVWFTYKENPGQEDWIQAEILDLNWAYLSAAIQLEGHGGVTSTGIKSLYRIKSKHYETSTRD